ncbi:MAG: YggS family pyridoxal phosphate-dependent enzyme [Candidatus Marinimicrobia bacterium]|nr:YggS family pyridoxal phosphate-dependent enzyme [Candidatus Neomarinimicrobiota bacterium]|tara:strand:+ start:25389 stop:26075 length:687 start_codon:yes stop_codon:yes gene_type:complete
MSLNEKLEQIRKKIFSAQKKGDFNHPVQIIAVTKTRPFQIIKDCYNANLSAVGENRIQEAIEKFKNFTDMPGLTRRFIGHLQSNKVNKCLELFDTVDSVDSVKLARRISNRAHAMGKTYPVLLEVNTSGETQKSGFNPSQTEQMLVCMGEKNIQVEGLMTIGPHTTNRAKIRKSFIELRKLAEMLNNQFGEKKLKELSMGMSGDYEIAAEEGSTMVRLGTVLFGSRKY